ncbi:O-methyltransferase-domain-containing protein [Apiospora saccharicola]
MDHFLRSIESADPGRCSDESERLRVADALLAALRRFQQPSDIVFEHSLAANLTLSTAKTLIDAGVLQKWAESGGGTKSSGELARLKRLVRHLAAQHLLTEAGEDAYQPTPWSTALATDPLCRSWYGLGHGYDLMAAAALHLPAFLGETGYRNPTGGRAGNFQHLRGGTAFFDYIGAQPSSVDMSREFNDAMEYQSRAFFGPWVDIYPTETIVASARAGRALVVDIGGGKGHDLDKFRVRHQDDDKLSEAAGVLVLQDLPDVVEKVAATVDLDPAIAAQSHDFFTPQPVRGARAYYMHKILHDWDDGQSVQILTHVAGAMEKGYSRLLIHEYVIDDRNPHRHVTTLDLTMMACLGSKERTEAEYAELLGRAGLKLRKVWRLPQAPDGVIEAELA